MAFGKWENEELCWEETNISTDSSARKNGGSCCNLGVEFHNRQQRLIAEVYKFLTKYYYNQKREKGFERNKDR